MDLNFSQEKKGLIMKLLGILSVEVNYIYLLNTLHYRLQLLTGYRSKAIPEKRLHQDQDGED